MADTSPPPSSPQPPDAPDVTPPSQHDERPTVPVFTPQRLSRQMLIDGAIHWSVLGLAALIVMVSIVAPELESHLDNLIGGDSGTGIVGRATTLVLFAIIGTWLMMGVRSARIWQDLQRLTPLIDADPDRAEANLARPLSRLMLPRALRLMLYHRLAAVRFRQHRFQEAAAICRSLLPTRVATAMGIRANLLLIELESNLECVDQPNAMRSLGDLAACPLSLGESLQRMALETRFLLATGRHEQAVAGAEEKAAAAELMPAHQSGVIHAMLAVAAAHEHRTSLAWWLRRRAELLCTPQAIEQFDRVHPMPTIEA